MVWNFLDFLKPAPYKPVTKSSDEINREYRHWRFRVCYSILFGYAVFYFTRKNFNSISLYMMQDLHFSKADVGLISSVLCITYGISKFANGVLSDRSNPRYFMAIGLICTGFLNILFGFSSSLWVFILLWGLNGWFQAWGWPACCKQLNYWFAQSERGLWYSVCSTSHTLGGALIPILAVYCALNYGWRYAMFIPAGISIVMGFVLINRMRDVPRSLGLPTVEEYRKEPGAEQADDSMKHSSLSVKEILFKQILNNKWIWMLSITYFFVYVVRTVISDWTIPYLIEAKAMADMSAARGVFWFEVGGFAGMIAAGWGSDYFSKGNRVPAMVVCALGLILSIIGFKYVPPDHAYADMVLLALIGAFVFGPQMIVGLAAAEFVDKRAAAASNGFAGTLGYFGAAFAGYPTGIMIDIWGWQGFFAVLLVSSVIILLMLLPLWSTSPDGKKERNKLGWSTKRVVRLRQS